jgi:hypothetical protein
LWRDEFTEEDDMATFTKGQRVIVYSHRTVRIEGEPQMRQAIAHGVVTDVRNDIRVLNRGRFIGYKTRYTVHVPKLGIDFHTGGGTIHKFIPSMKRLREDNYSAQSVDLESLY